MSKEIITTQKTKELAKLKEQYEKRFKSSTDEQLVKIPIDAPHRIDSQLPFWCETHPGKSSKLTVHFEDQTTALIMTAVPDKASKHRSGNRGQSARIETELENRKLVMNYTYAGCPHCRNEGYVYWSSCCGILACHGHGDTGTCPKCSKQGKLVTKDIYMDFEKDGNKPKSGKTARLAKDEKKALARSNIKNLPFY